MQFTPAGADGAGTGDLVSTNNLSDVANAATSRTNLGAAASGDNTDLTGITFGDGTAIGAVGSATFGAGADGSLYSDGANLRLDAATQAQFAIAGIGQAVINGTQFRPVADDDLTLGAATLAWSDVYIADGGFIDFNNNETRITNGSTNINMSLGGTAEYLWTATAFSPFANDGNALGTATTSFSDAYFASGAIIGFNNGDVTLTHSANTLTISGASVGVNQDGAGTWQEGGVDISPIGQQTIYVPANAMTARTTSGCASGSTETTTNDIMLESMDCDDAADEFVQFTVQMPKSWDAGTVVAQFRMGGRRCHRRPKAWSGAFKVSALLTTRPRIQHSARRKPSPTQTAPPHPIS